MAWTSSNQAIVREMSAYFIRMSRYGRSSLRAEGFTRFDPWNDDPLHRDRLEDFSHLAGISLRERSRTL
jgi:hypothetical protein